jgi:Rrf2 family protein
LGKVEVRRVNSPDFRRTSKGLNKSFDQARRVKFSRDSYYGILALAHMAASPKEVTQAAQLAQDAQLPAPFVAKILQSLARHAILRSYRGSQRGYALARPATRITVREVVEALDGHDVFERCAFWSNRCSDRSPCALHDIWARVRPAVAARMARLTIAHLATKTRPHRPLRWISEGSAKTVRRRFKIGDRVSWNSEAGRVRGRIMKVITSPMKFKGYAVRASEAEPQYQIKSEKTDHIAMHKGSALRKLAT